MQIDNDDVLYFINRALDGMVQIAEALGDAHINRRPDFPAASSPYVILAHCVGLTTYWLGGVIAGRQMVRDREAEFQAQGTVAEICNAVRSLQQQLPLDIMRVQGEQPIAYPQTLMPRHVAQGVQHWRQGKVLMHTYEELVQHYGQLEITRDILLR